MQFKNLINGAFTLLPYIICCFVFLIANPGYCQQWKQYSSIQEAGWSESDLEMARQYALKNNSAAVMIVDQGIVVAAWGHIDHPYKSASIRKSLYDATMGATQGQGVIDVQKTLLELGIDDIDELSDLEKTATLEHLMTARSGIYHPAAYEAKSNADRRPKRGTAKPGESWYYNNWDFNLVCSAFQKLTDNSMKQAFIEKIVRPLGMEDFKPEHVFECLEPRLSNHPAVTIRISARDLARVGKLYLQQGTWEDDSIIPKEWIARSTQAHTTFEKGHYRGEGKGYGRLWWVFPPKQQSKSTYAQSHRILALGAGGQTMVLIPDLDLVVVLLADTDNGRGVSERSVESLMDLILASRTGKPSPEFGLGPVKAKNLTDVEPITMPNLSAVSAKNRSMLEGRYMAGDFGLRLYQHNDRLFAQPIGQPLNDVEVFSMSDGSLSTPLVKLKITPVPSQGKKFAALNLMFRGQKVPLQRVGE